MALPGVCSQLPLYSVLLCESYVIVDALIWSLPQKSVLKCIVRLIFCGKSCHNDCADIISLQNVFPNVLLDHYSYTKLATMTAFI